MIETYKKDNPEFFEVILEEDFLNVGRFNSFLKKIGIEEKNINKNSKKMILDHFLSEVIPNSKLTPGNSSKIISMIVRLKKDVEIENEK